MADPRTMHLDTLTRRWDLVAELVHCTRCLGALPPDVDGACEECGTGTPPGLPPAPPLVVDEEIPPTAAVDTSALDDGGALWNLIAELRVPPRPVPPEPPAPKLSWWQRFARWPNVG